MSTGLLKHREDARALLFVAVALAMQVGGLLLWPHMTWWMAVPAVLATSWMAWIVAVITHNTVHVPVFHSRRLNRWFQLALTLTYGHPVSAFVPGHNLSHHVHTQTRRDVMRTTKLRFRWNLLNVVAAPLVLARDITAADMAYAKAMRTQRPRWFRQWVIEYVSFFAFQAVFLVMSPVAWVLFFMVPHACAAAGIVGMNFLQHDGTDRDTTWNHSRNFVGPMINWWTFNNGYHTIHHMHPGLHWTLAPAAHAEQVAPHIHPALDQANMFGYIWRAAVWPGTRLHYLGHPVVLPDEGPDEAWIPGRGDTPNGVSLGAEA